MKKTESPQRNCHLAFPCEIKILTNYFECLTLQAVLQAICAVLTNAEKEIGLENPVGVGQRPRAIGQWRSPFFSFLSSVIDIF